MKMSGGNAASQVVSEPTVPDIIPIHCFNAWRCSGIEGFFLETVLPLIILIIGAAIVRRWRDLLLVTLVAMFASIIANGALTYELTLGTTVFARHMSLQQLLFGYGLMLLLAALVHAFKRGMSTLFARVWMKKPVHRG